MRFVFPAILIIIAIALFFVYVDPTYEKITELRAEQAEFDSALDRSKELIAIRDRLLTTYNNFGTEELRRIGKLLPDHVDSVRLIIDIDGIAARHGLRIQDVTIDADDAAGDGEPIGVVDLSFGVNASYSTLKQFLMDLENSLRILDVTSLSFSASQDDRTRYDVGIRTYWLR